MSNIRITSLNGQINGTSSTFGSTIQDGIGSTLQTTYLPKTSDSLQVYRYVCSATSTTNLATGNTATITLPSSGVGLGTGRFGQLTIRFSVLMINDTGGSAMTPRIMEQYLLATSVDPDGTIIQPPNFAKLLASSIDSYIPFSYSTTTVTPTSPGISLVDTAGIFSLTIASSTALAPGSTFNVLAEFDIVSGDV